MKLQGVNTVLSALKKRQETIKQVTKQVMRESANEILTRAKTNCKFPEFVAELSAQEEGENGWSVTTKSKESAYAEFGTGLYAKSYVPGLPESWQNMAWTFFVNGKGRTASYPFLYPAYQSVTAYVPDVLAEAIENTQ